MVGAAVGRHRQLHGGARRQHRQHGFARHPKEVRLPPRRRPVDRHGLSAGNWRAVALFRPGGRSLGTQAYLPFGVLAVRDRIGALRHVARRRYVDRVSLHSGDRRGDDFCQLAGDSDQAISGEPARPSPRYAGDDDVSRSGVRARAGRLAGRLCQLAGGVLHQRPDRRRGVGGRHVVHSRHTPAKQRENDSTASAPCCS